MADQIARGEELEKKAEKKLNGWGLFSSKYEDAADLFDKAANSFKLAKSWDQAGSAYVKLANCYIKSDSKHEAASAYADAAHCYKKTNTKESISCLEQAANFFKENGKLNMSARYYKEIAELCEAEQNFEQAIDYYERAADLFDSEEVTTSANQCKQKIAQFAAQLEQYQKSIEIYEFIAQKSLNNNLLKYGVKGHLLNAGICQLCKGKGDVVAISNALERYQDMDPTFSGTREYRLLADLADAIDQEDVAKFTDAVKEFDSMTQLDDDNRGAADEDVKDFGKMVVELVSGCREADNVCYWAYEKWVKGEAESIVDGRIEGMKDLEELERALRIAFWCLQIDGQTRPSIGEVIKVLEGTLTVDPPPPPFICRRPREEEEELSESGPEL